MSQYMLDLLKERGVEAKEIARIVLSLQKPFSPQLTLEECLEAVYSVLQKREVQYALLTGLALDQLAERGLLPEPLQTIVAEDEPLYGIDENLAMAIASIYGTVGITSFGYLDKKKTGIIGRLDRNKENRVNTFLDDLVAGIAAAASARIAHHYCKTP